MALGISAGAAHLQQKNGVDDGARTHDRWNHNPELYQLSYAHHCSARYSTTVFHRCTPAQAIFGRLRAVSNRLSLRGAYFTLRVKTAPLRGRL